MFSNIHLILPLNQVRTQFLPDGNLDSFFDFGVVDYVEGSPSSNRHVVAQAKAWRCVPSAGTQLTYHHDGRG